MASLTHHLCSFFILSSLVFKFMSSCQCFTNAQAPKVELALYYETLCPGCADFIVNYLPKLFETDVKYITNVNLIPWGNAKLEANNTVNCQHGEDECYFNTIEACALDVWPNTVRLDSCPSCLNMIHNIKKNNFYCSKPPTPHGCLNACITFTLTQEINFPFIKCIEGKLAEEDLKSSPEDEQIWKMCTQETKLDQNLVKHCYNSGRGQQLILMNANKTKSHEFVPWVLIDGNPLGDHYDEFIKYICEAYMGHPKPQGCQPKETRFTSTNKEKTKPVCYGEEELETMEPVN